MHARHDFCYHINAPFGQRKIAADVFIALSPEELQSPCYAPLKACGHGSPRAAVMLINNAAAYSLPRNLLHFLQELFKKVGLKRNVSIQKTDKVLGARPDNPPPP